MKNQQRSEQYDPNNWYDRHGVKRPEHIPFLTEEELERKFAEIKAQTTHGDWKQDGTTITCNRCNPRHSSGIPPTHLLQGTDDRGMPILKKIDI